MLQGLTENRLGGAGKSIKGIEKLVCLVPRKGQRKEETVSESEVTSFDTSEGYYPLRVGLNREE